MKDIKLKKQQLEDLVKILASGIGSLTNPSKLESTFKSRIQSSTNFNKDVENITIVEEKITSMDIYDFLLKENVWSCKSI